MVFGTSKYRLDDFKRADNKNRYAPELVEALNAKRNLLLAKASVCSVLAGAVVWVSWLIGLDAVFWVLVLACTAWLGFVTLIYIHDKVWDFAFWLQDQKKIVVRAKDYGVRDE